MGGEKNEKMAWVDEVDFKKISCHDHQGFGCCYSVKELVDGGERTKIPKKNGVYLILWCGHGMPGFNDGKNTGFPQNRVPRTTLTEALPERWVKGTHVIYIGKAGVLNGKGKSNLYTRLREYLKWYQQKKNKHHGGRDIWRIDNPGNLLVTWRVTEDVDPEKCEKALLDKFTEEFKQLPFANYRH